MGTMLGESMRRRRKVKKRPRTSRGSNVRWGRWFLGGLVAMLVAFAIGYAVADIVLLPAPEQTGRGIAVPDLTGETLAEAREDLRGLGLGVGEVTALPHPREPEGVVLAQSPVAGQQLLAGARVRLAVSAGPPRVRVPDVTGFSADAAEALLERVGFEVERREELSGRPAGQVIGVDPPPGGEHTLPARVTLVVSAGAPAPTIVDSIRGLEPESLFIPAVPERDAPPDAGGG